MVVILIVVFVGAFLIGGNLTSTDAEIAANDAAIANQGEQYNGSEAGD
jgi:hypothetical protein